MKHSFKQFMIEAPINDYELIGDFTKGKSFRHAQDRRVLTHPVSIARTKKKFENTDFVFNFIFVNSKEAKQYTEIGLVKPEWVRDNLGEEVYNAAMKNSGEDQITIIFTNNNGSERMPATAWILAHRIGHALNASGRGNNKHNNAHYYYKEAHDHLISIFSSILDEYYGKSEISSNTDKMTGIGNWMTGTRERVRRDQLVMKNFFSQVCTFKSARENNLRDWFEVINELIAQKLTTGKIKFNKIPMLIKGKYSYRFRGDENAANDELETLARDMEYHIDSMFGSIIGDIFVM